MGPKRRKRGLTLPICHF